MPWGGYLGQLNPRTHQPWDEQPSWVHWPLGQWPPWRWLASGKGKEHAHQQSSVGHMGKQAALTARGRGFSLGELEETN